jgi:outer membrane protein assembly factor BamE (lipoprotein component of BamABCDE complex)
MKRGVLFGVAAAIAVTAGFGGYMSSTTTSFDAATWRAHRGASPTDNPRREMLGAMRDEVLRPGRSRQEIVAILGEPERRDGGADQYDMGPHRYGIDDETLIIEYDSEGRLSATRITRG